MKQAYKSPQLRHDHTHLTPRYSFIAKLCDFVISSQFHAEARLKIHCTPNSLKKKKKKLNKRTPEPLKYY
jgi:hypothetical protein